jgi:hypothetical protein
MTPFRVSVRADRCAGTTANANFVGFGPDLDVGVLRAPFGGKPDVTRAFPVLMLTAHAFNSDTLVSSIKAGARAYVPKDEMADIQNFLIDLLTAREGADHSARGGLPG